MNQDRIGEIILDGTQVRLTTLTRMIVSGARRDQAIADFQSSILKHMRVLVDAGVENDFIGPMRTLIEVNADSYEAVSDYAQATNIMLDKINDELFVPEASA